MFSLLIYNFYVHGLKGCAGCRQTEVQTNKLKTARQQGAPIQVLIILVQIRHAAARPVASIARPTASLPLCPGNYVRGILINA